MKWMNRIGYIMIITSLSLIIAQDLNVINDIKALLLISGIILNLTGIYYATRHIEVKENVIDFAEIELIME